MTNLIEFAIKIFCTIKAFVESITFRSLVTPIKCFNYIIFHKGCFDGFTSFYLFTKSKAYEPKPFIYPDFPGATRLPPEIEGKRVVIMDVAYRPSLLKQIAEKAEQVLFLDHHQTHEAEIRELALSPPHQIVFRNDRCGATLVWDYFLEGKMRRPRFLDYIEDNYLGRWKIPETLPFIAGLEVRHKLVPTFENLKAWDQLLKPEYLESLISRGKIFEEQKNYLIQKMAPKEIAMVIEELMLRKPGLKASQE